MVEVPFCAVRLFSEMGVERKAIYCALGPGELGPRPFGPGELGPSALGPGELGPRPFGPGELGPSARVLFVSLDMIFLLLQMIGTTSLQFTNSL
jgi:hypothetical protein